MSLRTRMFQVWFRLSRPMTLGVRAIIENKAGQVLLVRHTYVPGLYFPGGGVERGEVAVSALARELVEEAGVVMNAPALLHGVYSNHRHFANDHVLLYRVISWKEVHATSRGEIAEHIWVDPMAPPSDTTPGTVRRLDEVYRGAALSDHW